MGASHLDSVLSTLGLVASGCGYAFLYLRDSILSQENPGNCVRCYFAIYREVAAQEGEVLLPLRRWLEQHLEIVAFSENDVELERWAVR